MPASNRSRRPLATAAILALGLAVPAQAGDLDHLARIGEVRTLPGAPTTYGAVALSRDGATVAAGESGRGVVRVWDVAGARLGRELGGKAVSIDAVAVSPDGRSVAASGPASWVDHGGPFAGLKHPEGAVVQTWDVATGRALATIEPAGIPYGLDFGPEGTTLAGVLAGEESGLAIWRGDDGRPVRSFGDRVSPRRGLFFRGPEVVHASDREGRLVAALELLRPRVIRVWDTSTGPVGEILQGDGLPLVDALALGPDWRTLAIIDADRVLTLWDVEKRSILRAGRRPTEPDPGPFPMSPNADLRPLRLAFAASGTRVVAGIADGTLRVYDASTADVVSTIQGPAAPVRAFGFVRDRIRVVAGGRSIPINGVQEPRPLLVWEAGPPPTP